MSTAFRITLTGAEQVPPVITSAFGVGAAVFDNTTTSLYYTITTFGLDWGPALGRAAQTPGTGDNINGQHFHDGARGANSGVVFDWLANDSDDFRAVLNPDGSWTIAGRWEVSDSGTSIITFAADFAGGTVGADVDLYANIHTVTNGGGEIRGQLVGMATDAVDVINGTTLGEFLAGVGGADTLNGLDGNDVLDGGAAGDTLNGGDGKDAATYENSTMGVVADLGTPANNTNEALSDSYNSIEDLIGSAFADMLTGNGDPNRLTGGASGDSLNGGGGADEASYLTSRVGVVVDLSTPANNTGDAIGDSFNSIEILVGSQFNDTLVGSAQIATLVGGIGADTLNGSAGVMSAGYMYAGAAVTANLANSAANTGEAAGDIYTSIEGLIGSPFDDVLTGDANANSLAGGLGADTLTGGALADFLDGEQGIDRAVFSGARAGYAVATAGANFSVVGPDGSDTTHSIETLQFGDGTFVTEIAALDGVLWRNNDGRVTTSFDNLPNITNLWQTARGGDFDGDGDVDILWRHAQGSNTIWLTEDGAFVTNRNLPLVSNSWTLAGVGDFDLDGDADILFRHAQGNNVIWEIENGQFVTNHNLPAINNNWRVAGVSDFDGDGDTDIVWRHAQGNNVIWEIQNSGLVQNRNLPTINNSFQLLGTGDFDGDGDGDLIWHHDQGNNVIWEIENSALVRNRNLPATTDGRVFAGTGDFDDDADSDILWRDPDGQVRYFEIQGGTFVSDNIIGVVDTSWNIMTAARFDPLV